MAKDYKSLAQQILALVGGKQNVKKLTHCMTRLRFVLKDESIVDEKGLNELSEVIGIQKASDQFQIIIGNDVAFVFDEILTFGVPTNEEGQNTTSKNKNVFIRIIDTISSAMAPFIVALCAAGLVKVLLILLPMIGVISKESSTYVLLDIIGDGAFYFLPILVAYSSANVFKANPYLAVIIAGIMIHPKFIALMSDGNNSSIFGIPVHNASYSYSIIPVLLTVFVMSYIEKVVNKLLPTITKNFFNPFVITLITAILALTVFGPIGFIAGNWLSEGMLWLNEHLGWIAVSILAAFTPFIVITGLHHALGPIAIANVASMGYDSLWMVAQLCSNLSQGGASLAVGVKSKNREQKSVAYSAAISALVGGVTEPALFGVTLKLKKPMIACVISGGVAGLFGAIMQLKCYAIANLCLTTLPMWMTEDNNMNIIIALITALIAIGLSFILTFLFGIEKDEADNQKVETKKAEKSNKKIINSPLEGEIIPLEKVNDSVFSNKMMGEGVAIIPAGEEIIAPFDGVVSAVTASKHAIGLTSNDGVELLIHVGLETVSLNGEHFNLHVKEGDSIRKDDLLLSFQRENIREKGFDLVTPIIITNPDQFLQILPTREKNIHINQRLITIL